MEPKTRARLEGQAAVACTCIYLLLNLLYVLDDDLLGVYWYIPAIMLVAVGCQLASFLHDRKTAEQYWSVTFVLVIVSMVTTVGLLIRQPARIN